MKGASVFSPAAAFRPRRLRTRNFASAPDIIRKPLTGVDAIENIAICDAGLASIATVAKVVEIQAFEFQRRAPGKYCVIESDQVCARER